MNDNELIPNPQDHDIKAEIDWRFEQIQYAIEKAASHDGVTWQDLVPSDFLNRTVVVNLGDNYKQTISGNGSAGQIGPSNEQNINNNRK